MSLIERLISIAELKGLNSNTAVYFTVDKDGLRVSFIVSYTEPANTVAPLDVIWIDPQGNAARRTSRNVQSEMQNTWEPVEEDSFWQEQTWDIPRGQDQDLIDLISNVGNPFFLSLDDLGGLSVAGGTLTGPLYLRPQTDGSSVGENEAVSKSWVDSLMEGVRSVMFTVSQQLGIVQRNSRYMDARVEYLEQAVSGLELSANPTYKHYQDESSTIWEIYHNLESDVNVSVWKPNGERMIPSSEIRTTQNTLLLTFYMPMAGIANITKAQ